jgi:hypothetical protein
MSFDRRPAGGSGGPVGARTRSKATTRNLRSKFASGSKPDLHDMRYHDVPILMGRWEPRAVPWAVLLQPFRPIKRIARQLHQREVSAAPGRVLSSCQKRRNEARRRRLPDAANLHYCTDAGKHLQDCHFLPHLESRNRASKGQDAICKSNRRGWIGDQPRAFQRFKNLVAVITAQLPLSNGGVVHYVQRQDGGEKRGGRRRAADSIGPFP